MKILIFNWQDIKNPYAGGAEVHMHEIFSRVVRLGHEVTLYCSHFEGAPKEETINGIKVIREGGRMLFNFYVPLRYFSRFRHERYDVILDNMNKIPFFTMLYVRKPLAFIIHHLFTKSIFLEASFPIALYVYLMERMAVSLLKKSKTPVFVVSPSTQSELLEHGIPKEQQRFMYNCVDHERYSVKEELRSKTPLIGYFGRIKKYKSVEHAIEAFALVAQKDTSVTMVVVGEGDNRKQLEELATRLGIASRVRFTGFVSEEEKVRLMQEVWFSVNPSSKEGWGLTVIEGNACGTPVIASNVPGLRDAVKDNETGLLYEYGNVTQLAEKIHLLLHDEAYRKRLSTASVIWAEKFNWNVVAKESVEMLNAQLH